MLSGLGGARGLADVPGLGGSTGRSFGTIGDELGFTPGGRPIIVACVEWDRSESAFLGLAYSGGSRENWSCMASSNANRLQPLHIVWVNTFERVI